ncbi:MAG TPA: acylphosphatase [Candidatus Thermoplasmatota archaeon]|nr:acylphosphatase [Candidatus Thermoplasmatota archaeon]
MPRVHVLVSGHVQGVFYRDATRRRAEELGLAGWVRNLPDGRVEAMFEGPAEAVGAIVRWCWRGPPLARVSGLSETPDGSEEKLEGFRILRTPDTL